MPRVRRGTKRRHRRTKILKLAKGFYGGRSRLYKTAKDAVDRALSYSYRDRRNRKRQFRRLWITRINAAARSHEMSYGTFMAGLKTAGVEIDRKRLAELAVADPEGFSRLAEIARHSLGG
ncbi:MAG: 50S ribosomal protein L20 [Acidobacteria bacterium]|nr:50S ribosomal protein L20 [Acidobacteriota bacterium]